MKYEFNHTNETNALIVTDYPWGFRLRTSQRYWIETVAKKGDRFCTQTLNPKNNKWCAVKKTTYSPVMVMVRIEDNGILKTKYIGVEMHTPNDKVQAFLDKVGVDNLNAEQVKQIKTILAFNKVMEGVTFKCELVSSGVINLGDRSPENIKRIQEEQARQEEHRKQQAKINNYINFSVNKLANNIVL